MYVDVKHVGSKVLYESAWESDAKRRAYLSSKKILGQTVSKIVSIGHGLEVGRHRLVWWGHVRLQTAPMSRGLSLCIESGREGSDWGKIS